MPTRLPYGEARDEVRKRAENPATIRPEGRPTVASRNYNDIIVSRPGPTAEYLTARIARDHPAILERMKAGEFKSVRAAALEAGVIKRRISIPWEVHGAAASLKRHFTAAEIASIKALL